jgi:hypothetical protein
LSKTQRDPYVAKADADKVRYEEEKANYNVSVRSHLVDDSIEEYMY